MTSKKSITTAVAVATVWMLGLRVCLKALGLVSTLVLVRLLTPEDFGLVAIAMSFFALLNLFKDFGFDTVIIQIRNPTREHYNTAWTFNLIFGIVLATTLVCSSEFIARFYKSPELELLIWVIASMFIISGLTNNGTLDFRKNLTFEKEFWFSITPKLIGVPCTLLLAFWLKNYWALTIGTIITQLTSLILGYIMHSFRPRLALGAAKELFNFSKWLMINNFIYFVNNRTPELFIGKVLNPQAAGFFSVANEVAMLATTELSAAVSRASYPGYSKVSDNFVELKKLYLRVLGSTVICLLPLAIGLFLVAELMVPVVLGDKWLETIPIIKIISIGGLLIALNSNASYVYMAIGNPRMSTILGSIRVLIFTPLLIYLLNVEGLIGAAWAILISSSVMFFVSTTLVIKKLGISLESLLEVILRPVIGVFVMVVTLNNVLDLEASEMFYDNITQLIIAILLGAVIYSTTIFLLWVIAGKPASIEIKLFSFVTRSNLFKK